MVQILILLSQLIIYLNSWDIRANNDYCENEDNNKDINPIDNVHQ